MSEIPDFERIAREVYAPFAGDSLDDAVKEAIAAIAEQLRLVWNARGAADIELVDEADVYLTAPVAAMVIADLRSLDR